MRVLNSDAGNVNAGDLDAGNVNAVNCNASSINAGYVNAGNANTSNATEGNDNAETLLSVTDTAFTAHIFEFRMYSKNEAINRTKKVKR